MKTYLSIIVACATFFLCSCASLTSTTATTAAQIAAVELSFRLQPNEKVQFVSVLSEIGSALFEVSEKSHIQVSDVVAAIKSASIITNNIDIKRYISEIALLVDTQWKGVDVNKEKVQNLGDSITKIISLIK